jgi:hypothetical protein
VFLTVFLWHRFPAVRAKRADAGSTVGLFVCCDAGTFSKEPNGQIPEELVLTNCQVQVHLDRHCVLLVPEQSVRETLSEAHTSYPIQILELEAGKIARRPGRPGGFRVAARRV